MLDVITVSSSNLDHHLIWIIIKSRSSSSLDHHLIWIIIIGAISEWCYLLILLVTWSFTEPTLFHVGCRPSLHVGLLQCLYMTLSQNGPPSTYIWPWLIRKARPTLTFDHERNTSTITSEWPNPNIWPWKELNPLTMLELPSPYIWSWKELNTLTMSEWHNPYIWPWLIRKARPTLTSDHERNTSTIMSE